MIKRSRSIHSIGRDIVLPVTLLAIAILFFQILYQRHSFFWKDLALTTGATLCLYLPYFWFRKRVPQQRSLHLRLTSLALIIIVPFILLESRSGTYLYNQYFISWGILAALLFASNVVAIRLFRLASTSSSFMVPTTSELSGIELDAQTRERLARGKEIYEKIISRQIRPEDTGRFVVIDVATGDYEIDIVDAVATRRLLERKPEAFTYAVRAGRPTAYRVGVR